jgi:hypothetical protein
LNYNREEKALLGVWDMQKQGFRSIPYEGIVALKSEGNIKVDSERISTLADPDQLLSAI